jgi:hypothetical protein
MHPFYKSGTSHFLLEYHLRVTLVQLRSLYSIKREWIYLILEMFVNTMHSPFEITLYKSLSMYASQSIRKKKINK